MRIGIDARKESYENCLGYYIRRIINNLEENENEYFIFVGEHSNYKNKDKNVTILKTNLGNSFKDEIKMGKLLKSQSLDECVFFDTTIPVNYNKNYTLHPWVFENLVYSEGISRFSKIMIKWKIKKANKIVCFTQNQKDSLIENINIEEEKISVQFPGFMKNTLQEDPIDIHGEIIALDIDGDFDFIKKIIKNIVNETKLNILVIGGNNHKKRVINDYITRKGINKRVFFTNIENSDKIKKSKALIYTCESNIFPYTIENAITNNIPIIATKTSPLHTFLGKEALYFSSVRVSNILDILKEKINKPKYSKSIKEPQIKI